MAPARPTPVPAGCPADNAPFHARAERPRSSSAEHALDRAADVPVAVRLAPLSNPTTSGPRDGGPPWYDASDPEPAARHGPPWPLMLVGGVATPNAGPVTDGHASLHRSAARPGDNRRPAGPTITVTVPGTPGTPYWPATSTSTAAAMAIEPPGPPRPARRLEWRSPSPLGPGGWARTRPRLTPARPPARTRPQGRQHHLRPCPAWPRATAPSARPNPPASPPPRVHVHLRDRQLAGADGHPLRPDAKHDRPKIDTREYFVSKHN